MISPLVAAAVATLTLAGVFPYPTKITTLKNGLTVVRVPFDSPGLVAYYSVVRVGSRNEVEPGHTGFAHFFEHMMFRGTKRFPEGARGGVTGKLGFVENAFTTDDVTVYYSNGPSSGLETLVDLEADRFINLDYAEPAFQTEALAVAGEYQKNASNPGLKIEEITLGTAFTKHPYQHTTIGLYEDIVEMPKRFEYSKTFFKRWYTPDNTIIVIAGDFDDAKLMATIEKHYGPWTGKAAKMEIPVEPQQKEARVAKLTWPTPTLPRLGMAWHSPAASTKTMDAATQQVLSAYLVGPTSPLHRTLVLEQQLVERFVAFYDHHRDPSFFGIDARLKSEANREAVSKAMLEAIGEVAKGKADAKRLDDIKSNLRFGVVMDLETPSQVAETLAWHMGIFGSVDAIDSLYANIGKVTAKDLSAFARKYLVDTNRTTMHFTVELKGGAN
ncbi:MAG: pitrilysin family protein [Archangium sp.]|nr:pitrilysin family protein [Archangium sp.]MDP3156373.1 pitrilysin family protein [Archangium sp.]MDP3570417.1 pitrilysin family protein [Archangium sp.]